MYQPPDFDLYETLGFDPTDQAVYGLDELSIMRQIRRCRSYPLEPAVRARVEIAARVLGSDESRQAYDTWRRSQGDGQPLGSEPATQRASVRHKSISQLFQENYGNNTLRGTVFLIRIDIHRWVLDKRWDVHFKTEDWRRGLSGWLYENPFRWVYVIGPLAVVVLIAVLVLFLVGVV